MCNHCQSHGLSEEAKNQVRSGFLSMLANSSSQISEMDAGILVKNIDGKVEVASFGSLTNIVSMSSYNYLAVLKVALDKAKSENDIQMAFMLFDQLVSLTDNLKGFMEELDRTTDEIKASLKEG